MVNRYNSRDRVFSVTLSQEMMERYLIKHGYQISTLSQIAKDFGKTAGEIMEKLNLLPSTFDYKVAYLPTEKNEVYRRFLWFLEEREKDTEKYYNRGGKWFWHDSCSENDLLEYIVDNKARAIMRAEFIERILS